MNKENITELVCGFLFATDFSVMGKWGEISNKICFKNKFFPENYFTLFNEQSHQLCNPETNCSMRIFANNLVYKHMVNNNFESEYAEFKDRITKWIIPEILKEYNLIIQRIGIVFNYCIKKEEKENFLSKYFQREYKNHISDFRFSKKEPVSDSLLNVEKEDYINKIYTVGNINGKDSINFDYQHFFIPWREDVEECQCDKIINIAYKSFQEEMKYGQ